MTPRAPIARYDIKHVYAPATPPMTEMQNLRAYGPVQPVVKERKWWRLWK